MGLDLQPDGLTAGLAGHCPLSHNTLHALTPIQYPYVVVMSRGCSTCSRLCAWQSARSEYSFGAFSMRVTAKWRQ